MVRASGLLAGRGVGVTYSVMIGLRIIGDLDHLQDSIDQVMDELVKLTEVDETLYDPSIGADLVAGEVEFSLSVDADEDEAIPKALGAIRTAIHAAGGGTPGWPCFERAKTISAELVNA